MSVDRRMSAMNAIFADPNYVADPFGAGGVWQRNADNSVATVSVFGKLLMLGEWIVSAISYI